MLVSVKMPDQTHQLLSRWHPEQGAVNFRVHCQAGPWRLWLPLFLIPLERTTVVW